MIKNHSDATVQRIICVALRLWQRFVLASWDRSIRTYVGLDTTSPVFSRACLLAHTSLVLCCKGDRKNGCSFNSLSFLGPTFYNESCYVGDDMLWRIHGGHTKVLEAEHDVVATQARRTAADFLIDGPVRWTLIGTLSRGRGRSIIGFPGVDLCHDEGLLFWLSSR